MREVHVMWLAKLIQYTSKEAVPGEHSKIIEILRSL